MSFSAAPAIGLHQQPISSLPFNPLSTYQNKKEAAITPGLMKYAFSPPTSGSLAFMLQEATASEDPLVSPPTSLWLHLNCFSVAVEDLFMQGQI